MRVCRSSTPSKRRQKYGTLPDESVARSQQNGFSDVGPPPLLARGPDSGYPDHAYANGFPDSVEMNAGRRSNGNGMHPPAASTPPKQPTSKLPPLWGAAFRVRLVSQPCVALI